MSCKEFVKRTRIGNHTYLNIIQLIKSKREISSIKFGYLQIVNKLYLLMDPPRED